MNLLERESKLSREKIMQLDLMYFSLNGSYLWLIRRALKCDYGIKAVHDKRTTLQFREKNTESVKEQTINLTPFVYVNGI